MTKCACKLVTWPKSGQDLISYRPIKDLSKLAIFGMSDISYALQSVDIRHFLLHKPNAV